MYRSVMPRPLSSKPAATVYSHFCADVNLTRPSMTHIRIAIVRSGAVGNFLTIGECNLAGDMEAFIKHIKSSRSRLHDVELDDIMVFGPWPEQPLMTELEHNLGEEPCHTADILSDLIGDKERAYFLVRITAPPLAAVAGASVLA